MVHIPSSRGQHNGSLETLESSHQLIETLQFEALLQAASMQPPFPLVIELLVNQPNCLARLTVSVEFVLDFAFVPFYLSLKHRYRLHFYRCYHSPKKNYVLKMTLDARLHRLPFYDQIRKFPSAKSFCNTKNLISPKI